MYVSIDECAAQKWCALHNVDVPNIRSWTEALQFIKRSQYQVERSFNALSWEDKELLIVLADIEPTDQVDPFAHASKLHHFNKTGQRKLAHALRKIRVLSARFPRGISTADFFNIDLHILEGENHGASE